VNLTELQASLGRRFARLVTNAVVAQPWAWRIFRRPLQAQFDRLAPRWSDMRREGAFAALELALDALPQPPARVLDLGTGTGLAAFLAARRFPEAEVVGADVAEAMLAVARADTPPELAEHVRFEAGDAAELPFDSGSFDLVILANMIPFFDELDRVLADDGHLVFSFSGGPDTPIWVPPERLRRELGARGFADFADFESGGGTALLARKPARH
jgi:SAM-dependent methyltransferase